MWGLGWSQSLSAHSCGFIIMVWPLSRLCGNENVWLWQCTPCPADHCTLQHHKTLSVHINPSIHCQGYSEVLPMTTDLSSDEPGSVTLLGIMQNIAQRTPTGIVQQTIKSNAGNRYQNFSSSAAHCTALVTVFQDGYSSQFPLNKKSQLISVLQNIAYQDSAEHQLS